MKLDYQQSMNNLRPRESRDDNADGERGTDMRNSYSISSSHYSSSIITI